MQESMPDRAGCRPGVGNLHGGAALLFAAILAVTPRVAAQDGAPPQSASPQETVPAQPAVPSAPDPNQQSAHPLAIVPLDTHIPGAAAEVTGSLQVFNGRAFITRNGTVTAGSQTVPILLPYRGTLRVCAATSVNLATDSSVPTGEVPGLMMALDHGAVEVSFATGRNSDFLITPDFRILIGGPGAAEVKVRLAQHGDTCVDNAGLNAPYVLVSSVFDGGAYRVQPGQRVMFQHGSLHEVVDQEKEPCGCPPETKGANDFPLAQSEGLAPILHPEPLPAQASVGHEAQSSEALVYNAGQPPAQTQPKATAAPPAPAPAPEATPAPPVQPKPSAPPKKRGFFGKLGGFFRRVFGAD